MHTHLKPLAASLSLLFVTGVQAEQNLDPVVVTATRQATRVTEVLSDVTVINSADIRNAGPVATVGELLARQPGIEFKQNGGPGAISDLFIRGSNSSHVLLLVDGMRIGSVTTGTSSWESIPIEQIDYIEIVRGPASSLYGSDAVGGVVQIFTKRGDGPPRTFVEAGYGTYNTKAVVTGITGGQDGWRYAFQVSDKRSDSFSAFTNPSKPYYNTDKDGYQITGSSGSLSYSPASGREFGINYLYSDGWSRFDDTPASHDHKQKKTLYSANLFSKNRLTDNWTGTVQIGQSVDDSRNLDNGQVTSSYRSTQNQYLWQNDIKLSVGSALVGVERVEQHVSSDTSYVLSERSINSVLAGWKAQIDRHNLQFNARQDSNSQFGDKVTGMAAYGYQLARQWRGNVSWGSAFKAPSFNDLYYPSTIYGISNPNLKPESSDNKEVALHYETDTQHASVTFYRNEVKDLIQWVPVDPTYTTSYAWTPSNISSATLTGWTLAYTGKVGDYRLSGSLDIQDPRDDVLQKTLLYRARQLAKLVASRDFGNFSAGAELQAVGKRYADAANTDELGGYMLANLRASYRLDKEWSLFANANNIFDKKYVLAKDFATPGTNIFVGIRYTPK